MNNPENPKSLKDTANHCHWYDVVYKIFESVNYPENPKSLKDTENHCHYTPLYFPNT